MELEDVLRTTFSARDFTSDPLPDATLYRILDRARFAPSGGNRQGWRVVVVRDRATREALAALNVPAAKRYAAQAQNGENPPEINIRFFSTGHWLIGMGHDRATSVQAAIGDAIYQITGKRFRDLPYGKHDLTWS